jgi:hypothetical protein
VGGGELFWPGFAAVAGDALVARPVGPSAHPALGLTLTLTGTPT